MVQDYEWSHGTKYVKIHPEKKGLKEHIFWCGDLSRYFKGIAIFEDDLYVSPYYYKYLISALDAYADEPNVAGISLYNSPINSLYQIPFIPLRNGSRVYAYQDVATWGEAFNERMWNDFRSWLANWEEDFNSVNIPPIIKSWTRAWSKYHYAYMVRTNRYFIFPYDSLVANFNDSAGEHGVGGNKWTSFALMMGEATSAFFSMDDLVKYDVYCHNVGLYDCLGLDKSNLNIDFYGTNVHECFPKKFLLSTSILPYKLVKSFALTMRPLELNVFSDMAGDGIYLYDTEFCNNHKMNIYPNDYISYHLQGFSPKLLTLYVKYFLFHYIKRKIVK